MYLPQKVILTSGYGISDTVLNSFDNALIRAGIHDFNLVKVSSIAPKDVSLGGIDFLQTIRKGTVLPVILARHTAKEKGRVASAVCLLQTEEIGLITEYSGACTEKDARTRVLAMAETMCEERDLVKKDAHLTSVEYDAQRKYTTVISACLLV
jgi:pyruvoyl-dependent arginine decarboxylase